MMEKYTGLIQLDMCILYKKVETLQHYQAESHPLYWEAN